MYSPTKFSFLVQFARAILFVVSSVNVMDIAHALLQFALFNATCVASAVHTIVQICQSAFKAKRFESILPTRGGFNAHRKRFFLVIF